MPPLKKLISNTFSHGTPEKGNLKRCLEPLLISAFVMGIAVFLVHEPTFEPVSSSLVSLLFLAATWLLVWRHPDEVVIKYGLGLGGFFQSKTVEPHPNRALLRRAWRAFFIATMVAIPCFIPFFYLWKTYYAWQEYCIIHKIYFAPNESFIHMCTIFFQTWKASELSFHGSFHPPLDLKNLFHLFSGQLLIVALPEEVFFRGYLQSRLGETLGLPPGQVERQRLAALKPELLGDMSFTEEKTRWGFRFWIVAFSTAILFALGHLATEPHFARLLVFFPSLLFSVLRRHTGGIGASVFFHAFCNIFSSILAQGYNSG